MIKIIILLFVLFLSGCSTAQKKDTPPPSVSTAQVVSSLEETKLELEQAGESNTKIAININKALTLAEKLEKLLEQIEKENANKNVINPK